MLPWSYSKGKFQNFQSIDISTESLVDTHSQNFVTCILWKMLQNLKLQVKTKTSEKKLWKTHYYGT